MPIRCPDPCAFDWGFEGARVLKDGGIENDIKSSRQTESIVPRFVRIRGRCAGGDWFTSLKPCLG